MKKAIIFGGTTEGRNLAKKLISAGVSVIYSVATEYGLEPVKGEKGLDVRIGRMDSNMMAGLFKEENPDVVIDATHPFAEIVKNQIDTALFLSQSIPFIRILRENSEIDYSGCTFFDDALECAKALENTEGNILLTTGSKELAVFCENQQVRSRIIARVIPSVESLDICTQNGLTGKQIIAMQGPFSLMMNRAQIKETRANVLVLKNSGKGSGEAERIEAAKLEGIKCFVINRPTIKAEGKSFKEALDELENILETKLTENGFSEITPDVKIHITLASFGMGFGSITEEVMAAVDKADIIFGAPRMLSTIECKAKKYPYYLAKDILPVLNEKAGEITYGTINAVVLFSGDTGFFSGTKKLYDNLKNDGRYSINILPGISSISALSARLKESYEDAIIMSTHGIDEAIWQPRLIEAVKYSKKVFTLTSGGRDVRIIGELLQDLERNFNIKFEIWAGFNLYSDEKLVCMNSTKCSMAAYDGLCVLLIKNKNPLFKRLAPGLSDEEFLRNKTPMSKEEIRALSICKLGITRDAIVYDIGGGSGSVSVEIGLLASSINVYTIEFKEDACKLIRENISKQGLKNVHLIEGVAPDALDTLPTPSHVFIGGSGGRLKEILKTLQAKGHPRVVINAVTLETIAEVNSILKYFEIKDADVVQVSISKAKTVGDYNVMQAQNPVYVVTFTV